MFLRFSTHISLHCVRAQILGYYYSLTFLLEDVPAIRQSYFMIGQAAADPSGADLCPDHRCNHL